MRSEMNLTKYYKPILIPGQSKNAAVRTFVICPRIVHEHICFVKIVKKAKNQFYYMHRLLEDLILVNRHS